MNRSIFASLSILALLFATTFPAIASNSGSDLAVATHQEVSQPILSTDVNLRGRIRDAFRRKHGMSN